MRSRNRTDATRLLDIQKRPCNCPIGKDIIGLERFPEFG
jgi:hypothetical protein